MGLHLIASWVLGFSLFSSFPTIISASIESATSSIAPTATVNAIESQLVLQDINILVVTDVHSWVGGHPHDDTLNADYGSLLSFYQRLNSKALSENKDLFFVMNGDFMDGTGLTTDPPKYLIPILSMMPWDAINIGNHELYKNSTIEYITQPGGFVDFWDGKYLTSNVFLTETNETRPIGSKYRFLEGSLSNRTVLTFGFLYDFQNHCLMTEVEDVEKTVNDTWFIDVVEGKQGNFDAILVLAHMDAFDPLVNVILAKIREICGDNMPVQFISGHTHQRKFQQIDPFSTSFEAGRYLDTVGFTSLSFNSSIANFEHKFIDGDINDMKELLGMAKSEPFETKEGKNLTDLIRKTQDELGLNKRLGCSPSTYYLDKGVDSPDSLWGLFVKTIVPKYLFKGSASKLFLQNIGGMRYSLFKGNLTVDDLISITPYNDTLYFVAEGINGSQFTAAFSDVLHPDAPQMVIAGKVVEDQFYDVYSVDFDVDYVTERLENITGRTIEPIPLDGRTTGTLWMSYIKESFVCPPDPVIPEEEEDTPWNKFKDFFESFTVVKMIAFIMTFFVVVFFGWMFLCRHPRQRVSDGVEDQSFGDDSGNVSYDYSDDDSDGVFPISSSTPINGNKSYQSIPENGIV
jgi:2',3'-cyclic-nucleotide 2'-phosphodiesterase (5'-nucleotidase family)